MGKGVRTNKENLLLKAKQKTVGIELLKKKWVINWRHLQEGTHKHRPPRPDLESHRGKG